jgi:hypothetical protein
VAEPTDPPPAFAFDGTWPFSGSPSVNGHPVAAVSWDIQAAADSLPVVTLALVGRDALKLLLSGGAARVQVSDSTREALESLGWTPPAT